MYGRELKAGDFAKLELRNENGVLKGETIGGFISMFLDLERDSSVGILNRELRQCGFFPVSEEDLKK